MGKYYFTKEQIQTLQQNQYVLCVSEKAITYTDTFKITFLSEYAVGKSPNQIFSEYGFDTSVLGESRIHNAAYRWKQQAIRESGVIDTRKLNSGRPSTKCLTVEQQNERLLQKIKFLEMENTILKKLEQAEREANWKANSQKKKHSK